MELAKWLSLHRNRSGILLLTLCILTGLTLLMVLAQQHLGYNLYVQTFALFLFVGCFYALIKMDTLFFILLFMVLFNMLAIAGSTLVIENGAFMMEVRREGYCTGATIRFVCYSMLFITSCYLIFRKLLPSIVKKGLYLRKNLDAIDQYLTIILFALYAFIILYVLIVTAIWGAPLLMGVNRVYYWNFIAPAPTRYLVSLLPQLDLMLGILAIMNIAPKRRKLVFGIFFTTVFLQLLQGEKFSGLLLSLYFFFLPALIKKYLFENFEFRFKVIFRIFLGIAFLMGIVFYNYSRLQGDFVFAKLMILDRIALQGQVWWTIDEGFVEGLKPISYFVKHAMGWGAEEFELGLTHLMFLAAPSDTAMFFFAGGASFTGGFPAIFVVSLGYIVAGALVVVCGCFCGWVISLLLEYIQRANFVTVFFSVKLFFATYLTLAMGNTYLYFSLKYMLFLLVCVGFKYFTLRIR